MRWQPCVAAVVSALALFAAASPLRAAPPLEWPNAASAANSDPWIAEHHDEIAVMRPSVLAINFVNGFSRADGLAKLDRLCHALAVSSRWHGYADPGAPAFLDYRLAKYVDLADPPGAPATVDGNSSAYPRVKDRKEGETSFDYQELYTERFARLLGIVDAAGVPLRLEELVARGKVHEVWLVCRQVDAVGAPWEAVEVKQRYDANGKKLEGQFTADAGNSGAHTAPWIGRSLRILFVNAERGIGCALHSLGHALEGTSRSEAIPAFTREFRSYAGFDLDERFGLPFASFYAGGAPFSFPAPSRLVYAGGEVRGYVAAGGNVHFPPNARKDYDDVNAEPVLSTIEHWRLHDGWDGADKAEPWTPARFASLAGTAPDGQGDWNVYWRQNMPGYRNRARDGEGKPLKNWWPYLFY